MSCQLQKQNTFGHYEQNYYLLKQFINYRNDICSVIIDNFTIKGKYINFVVVVTLNIEMIQITLFTTTYYCYLYFKE